MRGLKNRGDLTALVEAFEKQEIPAATLLHEVLGENKDSQEYKDAFQKAFEDYLSEVTTRTELVSRLLVLSHPGFGYLRRIDALIGEFERMFIEREELIRLIVLSIFAKRHIFLIGKPGVGKTDITETISGIFSDAKFWSILMTRDTKVDQLFGRITYDGDNKAVYDTVDTVLDSHFVLVDEQFKGPGETLNSLLQVMASGVFSQRGRQSKAETVSFFGCSNEIPLDESIAPFKDRYLFWYEVERIQGKENFIKLVSDQFKVDKAINDQLELADIDIVFDAGQSVEVPEEVYLKIYDLKEYLILMDNEVSDRKFRWAVSALKVAAAINGRAYVNISDLFLMEHATWHSYTERRNARLAVSEVLFGTTKQLDRQIMHSEEEYDKIMRLMKLECAGYLNYTTRIEGRNKAQIFDNGREQLLAVLDQMSGLYKVAESTDNWRRRNLMIGEQIRENVLVYGAEDRVFTTQMSQKVINFKAIVSRRVQEIADWLEKNPDLFAYEENVVQRRSSVA